MFNPAARPIPRVDDPTPPQQDIRTKFQEAGRYAKIATSNPAIKAAYKSKTPNVTSAYNTAVADYFKASEIINVDTTGYNAATGGTIIVLATDDFKVQSVQVSILDEAGVILRTGEAAVNPENEESWTHMISQSTPGGVRSE